MIGGKASEAELTAAMKARQLPLLIDDARDKLFAGETTVREALQAVTVW